MSSFTVPSRSAASPRRITIKDVAERAGVATAAVSVVLNGAKSGSTGISEAARARIVEAAQDLGYKRNNSMVAARSGHFNAVGLLLSTTPGRSTLPVPLWESILKELAAHDLHLIVQQLSDALLTDEAFIPKMLREWMCDGLLIDYTHAIPPQMLQIIHKTKTPAVWLNARLARDCIHPDDLGAGGQAARKLLDLGHRRIAYASHLDAHPLQEVHYSVADRREGARSTCEAAHLPLEVFTPSDQLKYLERVQQWTQRLRAPNRPTGIVTYGGFDGDVVLHAAENAGLRVPEDLSLVSFGDDKYSVRGQLVSMLMVPATEMGQRAVQQLKLKIQSPEQSFEPLALPLDWNQGQTLARASPP